MMRRVYMAVTQDKCGLPYAWADSAWELARLLGVDVTSILHAVGRREKNPRNESKYKLVWVSDQDDD